MDFQLRQATPGDAEAVVLMQTLAHEECYPHLLSDQFFRGRRASIPERVERRRPHLAVDDPRIIAVDANNELVGFADAGPGRDDDGPEELELYSIYTLRRTHGTGLGAALMRAAIGDGPAYLWVVEGNPRALAFYLKQGFRPDGKRNVLPPEWEELPESGWSGVQDQRVDDPEYVVLATKCATLGVRFPERKQNSLITLQQDAEGFIRMNRHYPASARIRINFADGSTGEFSGLALNKAYDAALAEFRAKNDLDARGYSRTSAGRTNSGNKIDFVPVHPGLQE